MTKTAWMTCLARCVYGWGGGPRGKKNHGLVPGPVFDLLGRTCLSPPLYGPRTVFLIFFFFSCGTVSARIRFGGDF